MSTQEKRTAVYATLYVERFGFSVIPIGANKKPAVKWMEFQERRPTIKEILSWGTERLAIVTGPISGIVVVDCDSEEDARWFWDNVAKSPAVVKTRRGRHFYFRHPGSYVTSGTKINGHYDVKGDKSYVLAPPSPHSEGEYHWHRKLTRVADLPPFKPEWRPVTEYNQGHERMITDGVAYIQHIRAVAGENGDTQVFRAACALKDSGLSEAQALLALQHWAETNAEPRPSNSYLLHKVVYAYKK